MTILAFIGIAVAVFVLFQVVSTWRRPRVRAIEWHDREKWIRFYPNPGWHIRGHARPWSRKWGRR